MNRDKINQIYEAVQKIDHAYEVWSASHGLTLYEMQIYYVILEKEMAQITQKELCQKLDAPKTSISSMIKRQLKTGYIEMKTNPENKREKLISLTDSGQTFAKKLIEPLFQYEEEAASMISKEELETAIRIQNQFADLLLRKVEQTDE